MPLSVWKSILSNLTKNPSEFSTGFITDQTLFLDNIVVTPECLIAFLCFELI